MLISDNNVLVSETVDFLADLVLSEDFSTPERDLIVQLAKSSVPSSIILIRGKLKVVEIAFNVSSLDVQEEKQVIWLLQTIVSLLLESVLDKFNFIFLDE